MVVVLKRLLKRRMTAHEFELRMLLLSVPTHLDKSHSIPKASGSTVPPHRPPLLGQISKKKIHLDDYFVIGAPSMQEPREAWRVFLGIQCLSVNGKIN
jgi:hypothetical protein